MRETDRTHFTAKRTTKAPIFQYTTMNITKHANKIGLIGLFSCALAGALALEGWLHANSIEQRQHLRAGSCRYCRQNPVACLSPELGQNCSDGNGWKLPDRPYCRGTNFQRTGYFIEETQAPNGYRGGQTWKDTPGNNCATTNAMMTCSTFYK